MCLSIQLVVYLPLKITTQVAHIATLRLGKVAN
jgi:hypothetical protein